ncbi:unnamed protein product [Urochloa decumbens]|uniref:RING-type E3 ubiquitin transferase n=1 Tax=Urochloa decumbens TaxID=240449 RepID=A0ABC9EAZ1_9POAL
MCRGIPSSSDAPPTSPPPRALFLSSVIFLSIFLVTFAVVAVLALCCCRRRARTSFEHTARASLSGGERGDQPFPVDTLPAFAYACQPDDQHGGTAATRDECAVCLGAVQEGEKVRRLPVCRHVYHVECIDLWLAAHRTCPLCRSELDPSKVNSESLELTPQEDRNHQLTV